MTLASGTAAIRIDQVENIEVAGGTTDGLNDTGIPVEVALLWL